MKKERSDLLGSLLDDLIRRESDPGEIHVCPYCNGELHVSIAIHISKPPMIAGKPFRSGWDRYLGVGARCENCNAALFSQYSSDAAPPWAKESEYNDMSIDKLWELFHKNSEE